MNAGITERIPQDQCLPDPLWPQARNSQATAFWGFLSLQHGKHAFRHEGMKLELEAMRGRDSYVDAHDSTVKLHIAQ